MLKRSDMKFHHEIERNFLGWKGQSSRVGVFKAVIYSGTLQLHCRVPLLSWDVVCRL